MEEKIKKLFKLSSFRVSQPLADFYVFKIKAKDLLEICIPVRLEDGDELANYTNPDVPFDKVPKGPQRKENNEQINQIRDYIVSGDAAFPNTIILGANLNSEGFRITNDDESQWRFEDDLLIIEKDSFKSSIIDGQHRVLGFQKLMAEKPNDPALQMEILCTLYLDIPLTYHAQIFTHINSTPRRVNRNLIYQLYQIDMNEKKPECWSTEVLAVYVAKALDSDENSPLKDRIKLSVKGDKLKDGWNYTFAALVEGILPLLTSNPVKDKNILSVKTREQSKEENVVHATRDSLRQRMDSSPFRGLYLEQKDSTIYSNILQFVDVIYKFLIKPKETVFRKSIGISACFLALKEILVLSDFKFSEVIQALESNLEVINLDNLPDIPSTKLQGIMKNTIVLSVSKDLKINTTMIKINIKDRETYTKLINRD